ncbi:hypothetical protein KIPB_009003 [Kipferlia bialata]|uniref:Nucleosome assembly protein n=1 Tax=Kipferlia bialata TaxID=797122 RepID=A0A9K3GLS8_9EUKA|nr:hypothetical protein KIPB_009003 [Kipferlia bialata]|eukprot:g9003.t1
MLRGHKDIGPIKRTGDAPTPCNSMSDRDLLGSAARSKLSAKSPLGTQPRILPGAGGDDVDEEDYSDEEYSGSMSSEDEGRNSLANALSSQLALLAENSYSDEDDGTIPCPGLDRLSALDVARGEVLLRQLEKEADAEADYNDKVGPIRDRMNELIERVPAFWLSILKRHHVNFSPSDETALLALKSITPCYLAADVDALRAALNGSDEQYQLDQDAAYGPGWSVCMDFGPNPVVGEGEICLSYRVDPEDDEVVQALDADGLDSEFPASSLFSHWNPVDVGDSDQVEVVGQTVTFIRRMVDVIVPAALQEATDA